MSDKTKIIAEMLEMQKKFIAFEQENGIDMKDYYAGKEGHALYKYVEKYDELSNKLNAMAHEEKGSTRFF
ncbi:hypothetical protein MNBD_GAMMA23-185 [hydrothermal vent metagenome]|uniref:Uncharacterized protein n=1 Tax=hydrothermal vent metagenome TaxID=652676 RepID=A0A3B0ZUZ9_9ZZZZ